MKSIHSLITRLATCALVLAFAATLSAQTALTTTTLGAIVADGAVTSVTVASATGITAPGTGSNFVLLLVDRELMAVRNVNGTTIGVARGQNGTRATPHINGAAVTVAPAIAVINYVPSGQCVRTNLTYVPVIVGGTNSQPHNGDTYDCLGVTTAGQFAQTNANGTPVFGSTVVSANTITVTGTYFKTSGTTIIKTINVPAGAQPGFSIVIEATAVDTWDATGNILTAGTFTAAGHTVQFYWNGSKWVPDKVA